jgi:putative addiction module component (TIGR02574 family)
MTAEARSLFEAAMKLSEAERIVLAERLLDTVSAASAPAFDTAWEMELERRAAEMDRSEDAGIFWQALRSDN